MKRDTSSTLGNGNLVLFISFPTHLYSSLVMDRQGISPSDIWHLRQQAPQDYAQEKLPKLKSATSTSYYDLDIDHMIPFYGTQESEEYLEWECLMDDYLKLHQVPPEDQVKCATRNFHDYASTWWLHTPSESYGMSWHKKRELCGESSCLQPTRNNFDANWRTPSKDPSPSTSTSRR